MVAAQVVGNDATIAWANALRVELRPQRIDAGDRLDNLLQSIEIAAKHGCRPHRGCVDASRCLEGAEGRRRPSGSRPTRPLGKVMSGAWRYAGTAGHSDGPTTNTRRDAKEQITTGSAVARWPEGWIMNRCGWRSGAQNALSAGWSKWNGMVLTSTRSPPWAWMRALVGTDLLGGQDERTWAFKFKCSSSVGIVPGVQAQLDEFRWNRSQSAMTVKETISRCR